MTLEIFSKQKQRTRRERLLSQLDLTISRKQKRIADELNRRTQHWNRASKLILFFLFCLVFGGISLWLLIQACH